MSDGFDFEQCVKKEINKSDNIKYYCYIGIMIFGIINFLIGAILILQESSRVSGIIQAVFSVAAAVFGYIKKDSVFVEYDYSFDDKSITIAKIFNNVRRKEVFSIRLDQIEYIAPATDPSIIKFKSNPNIKKINLTLTNREKYYIYGKGKSGYVLVYFEPNQEFLKQIKSKKASAVQI